MANKDPNAGLYEQVGGSVPENPLGTQELPQPSPVEEHAAEIDIDNGVAQRLKEARAVGPSVRRQTQAEMLNLVLLRREMGSNPFSVRVLPFSTMRDMAADPTIGFALYYIETPLINANYSFESPDAQLAAATDAAFRPINSDFKTKTCGSLRTGYQPMVKRWKLEKLAGTYRDKTSKNPDEDLPVWPSKNVDALVWKTPLALPPENCLPKWGEDGSFDGFMYSPVPIPNPMMLGVAQTYGPVVLSGTPIPLEYAMWKVNERAQVFGSLFGNPRTRRAYRFWWSFWMRWAFADRSYENKSDPAKIIYYPTNVTDALDPNSESETPYSLQQKAIQAGNNLRSGTTTAFPGDFMVGEDGKTFNQRKWDAKYLEGGENFSLLDQNFAVLQTYILRACFLPEQAFIDATTAAQTSSQRYISAQQGEIYQESQQLLSNEDDEYVNKYWIPEFIAANFPDKAGIPCKKVTRGYGSRNSEMTKQILQIIGQKNPERVPVDLSRLLEEEGYPLNSEAQQKLQEEKHKEALENSKPPIAAPTKTEGTAGYNAGIEKTETGEHIYFQPGEEILLSSSSNFWESMPKIPPYEDVRVKSAAMQMRKLLMDRYKNQIASFADQIRNKTILKLAQEEEPQEKPGLGAGAAKVAAAGAVAGWIGEQSISFVPASLRLKEILARIVGTAGKRELKLANLDPSVYDASRLDEWVENYVNENLKLMDQTVQEEFKEFLESQLQINSHPDAVAQAIEDHFAELPETHTARAVRAQTRDAYNKGMLQAGIDAGIDQVMAHDASSGTNLNTDPKCINRNGKIFTPHEALKETEHPNGCVVPETMILSSKGYVPIETLGNIFGERWQDIGIDIAQESSLEQANKFFVNGDDEVYKLTTVRGHEFIATWKHKIRVVNDSGDYTWKKMCEVKHGDIVVMNLGGHESLLNDKPYLQNGYLGLLDEKFSEVLGYYIGDGYVKRGKRSGGLCAPIGNNDEDLIDWFEEWAHLHGYNVCVELSRGCKIVNICDIKIPKLFDELGYSKKKADFAKVPLAILESKTSVVTAFLRGLFEADGQVDLQKSGAAQVLLSTISNKLAIQVHSLLESLGIRATLSIVKDRKSSYGYKPLYRVIVASISDAKIFCDKIGFISNRKQTRLEKSFVNSTRQSRGNCIKHKILLNNFYDCADDSNLRRQISSRVAAGSMNLEWATKVIENNPSMTKTKLAQLLKIGSIQFVEVSNVKNEGRKHTVDISVPEGNTYIADGFISHNTLYWTYLNTSNLSVKVTDNMPDSLDLSENMQAGYESSSETLFIRESAKDDESKYLAVLGERLKLC